MRIVSPTEIERVAWEGALEPLGEAFRSSTALPRVTLGEPACWPPAQALESQTGKAWSPPAGDRRYTLVQLTCTLHPPPERRTHYSTATLTAYLSPRYGSGRAWAHDLYPRRLAEESKTTFSIALGPDLKFAEAFELSLLEAGAEVEVHKAFPVIQGYGLGESRPYWRFARYAAHPLQGCQSVYLVLSAPPAAEGVRLTLELVAELETRYGPIRAGLPEEARAHVSRVVGE